jgi:hypothetical protein
MRIAANFGLSIDSRIRHVGNDIRSALGLQFPPILLIPYRHPFFEHCIDDTFIDGDFSNLLEIASFTNIV